MTAHNSPPHLVNGPFGKKISKCVCRLEGFSKHTKSETVGPKFFVLKLWALQVWHSRMAFLSILLILNVYKSLDSSFSQGRKSCLSLQERVSRATLFGGNLELLNFLNFLAPQSFGLSLCGDVGFFLILMLIYLGEISERCCPKKIPLIRFFPLLLAPQIDRNAIR